MSASRSFTPPKPLPPEIEVPRNVRVITDAILLLEELVLKHLHRIKENPDPPSLEELSAIALALWRITSIRKTLGLLSPDSPPPKPESLRNVAVTTRAMNELHTLMWDIAPLLPPSARAQCESLAEQLMALLPKDAVGSDSSHDSNPSGHSTADSKASAVPNTSAVSNDSVDSNASVASKLPAFSLTPRLAPCAVPVCPTLPVHLIPGLLHKSLLEFASKLRSRNQAEKIARLLTPAALAHASTSPSSASDSSDSSNPDASTYSDSSNFIPTLPFDPNRNHAPPLPP